MSLYWGLILSSMFCNFLSCYFIKTFIDSIVMCDRRGGDRSLKKINKNHKWYEKLTQYHYKQYLTDYKKAFDFWFVIKIVHLLFFVILFCCSFMISSTDLNEIFAIVFYCLSSLFCLVMIMQFDINRDTKYDRIRQKKKYDRIRRKKGR